MGEARNIVLGLLLAVVTTVVFWPMTGHQFLSWDDNTYVSENRALGDGLSLASAAWALTAFYGANWHPLSWLSHALDVSLFGLDPAGHHAMSLLLHAVAAATLFFVLSGMTGAPWPSALVAALFALHPLHVESVAWLAERKDVLCALFSFLTLWWYLSYLRRPGAGRYFLVLAGTALALSAKGMAVTLPLMLLLVDWWPLGRLRESPGGKSWRWILIEKAPPAILALGSGMLVLHAQGMSGALEGLAQVPLPARTVNALISWTGYLGKTVWPTRLSYFYPYPAGGPSVLAGWCGGLLIGGSFAAALRLRHRRPYLAVGWVWYSVTLLPVVGILQVGSQARADRYTYLPLVGVFVAAAWTLAAFVSSGGKARFRAAVGVTLAALLLLAGAAREQLAYWRDDETLFSRAILLDPRNWMAYYNLANSYRRLGLNERAAEHYGAALEVRPDHAEAHNNLGVTLMLMGRTEEALRHFREAAALRPRHAPTWFNLGLALRRSGHAEEARGALERAVGLDPDLAGRVKQTL